MGDAQPQREYLLHVFASNQSKAMPLMDLDIRIDERQILHRAMTTGTQHNWEQVTVPMAGGEYTVVIVEDKSGIRKSQSVNIDRELWIVVTFHSPPAHLKIGVFDHPISFM